MKVRVLLFLLPFFVSSSWGQVPMPKEFKRQGVSSKAEKGTSDLVLGRRGELHFSEQLAPFFEALKDLGWKGKHSDINDFEQTGVQLFLKGKLPPGVTYRIQGSGSKLQGPASLSVTVNSPEGAAHAASTLLQMVEVKDGEIYWPNINTQDGPDVPYRSFMVDMGRNPHSPKLLKQIVDMLWMYKANYLHLHLSDDQLCSWPSKAFPKIYSERAGWTWEDFVELENYSQARGVTIIPEFDVPGHSTIFRREYPEVFGKTPTNLAKNPEAQKGVETLIEEVLSVFKATPYYHMGGDEAYGVPQELQRDFINRINKFVKSKDRQLLVWEGPHMGKGENKVDEDVIHIIWRNIEMPAQSALDAGYQVVNAPWNPTYIVDHYPRTMFTAVDVERCYNWNLQRWAHINHGMATFKNPHFTKSKEGILGFCMPWWEGREENLMPLCLPRFAAISAAAWNREGEKDFASFQKRQAKVLPILEKISGIKLPTMPVAEADSQKGNLAFGAKVIPSDGAAQPHFGPQRLTNGLTDRFDHFLGFPTQPDPLEIVVELREPAEIAKVVVFEAAVGQSHEIYDVLISADGKDYRKVGESKQGTRGEKNFVEHSFDPAKASHIKIRTSGCHGLTFPSFSRLCEIQAFGVGKK